MPGGDRMRAIARVGLVRVFAVLALVVGVALLQGTPCERDVAWTSQCATASVQILVDVSAEGASDLLEDLGGVPGACLALLLAVLFAVAGLRRPRRFLLRAVRAPLPWQGTNRHPEVQLTRLCVMRT